MAQARWAKWRAEAESRPEPEPKMLRAYPLELGVRDTRTGEVAWVPFKSVRDATRRLAMVARYYLAPDL